MSADFKITIAGARVSCGLTQQEFADKLSVHRSTVVNWEKGKTLPDLPHLRLIEEITGIPKDYIFLPTSLPKVDNSLKFTPKSCEKRDG